MIYKLKADEVFIPGVHFYSIGNGKTRGKCIYNLQSCREALLKKTKDLAKNKLIQQPEIYKDDQIKKLIEKAIRSRAYISEINQRYNKMTDKKRKNFFRRAA